ncbi:MAG: nucleoside-diphosphate sugar epimerase/dehydratase [Candidatus Faecousia sp.]|uniref:polysaccharide biosynthesis protein n=1 Tax=Faecousia sp. TaxID=2952921 RepID=UPI002A8792D0|nr:nucleoside-diphosphate sugar epimerase/dehydratase [Candidatus Faecousia sp.]
MKKAGIFHSDDAKRTLRVIFLALVDLVVIQFSAFMALLARFDFSYTLLRESMFLDALLRYAPWFTMLTVLIFIPFKLYSSLWEFASVDELLHILLAAMAVAVLQFAAIVLNLVDLPLSFPMLNAMFLAVLTVLFRFSYRMARSIARRRSRRGVQARTMLIGAGSAGMQTLREFETSENSKNHVVCIIDDDPQKTGRYLNNVKIVGTRCDIAKAAQDYRVEEIVFAIPAAPTQQRKQILKLCQETGCKLKILPGISQLANGEVKVQKIRDVDVLDLLGRDSVQVDLSQIAEYLSGKTVLVTGGGGSIGSELCRQIAGHRPKRLVIFDIYENNAYDIQQELRRTHPGLELITLIGSVRDTERVNMLFETYRPEIVFHAAAHKHVPLMEDSPNEAIKNNVFGTYHVARAADRYGTKTFVLISTDKAVNPTNVMGASKRICEMIVQTMANRSATKFVAVRFGNVLGSNGSVIPLFKRQIAEGGPVTVTHPDIIRYFMTIPEAVQLVLQAGAYANRGEIFVLDMGEPVRIDDLARNLIRLSGFTPDEDIEIRYTGLRPGEKLFEEMLMDEEGLRETANKLIHIGQPIRISEEHFLEQLAQLETACEQNSPQIRALIARIVPTYHRAAVTQTVQA